MLRELGLPSMRYTPKKTVAEIVTSENHYCIGLKGNQPTLLQQAQQCAQTQVPLSCDYQVLDDSHSRLVERRIQVFEAPPALSQDWPGLAAFVSMERSGMREGIYFHRQSWYILSQPIPAQRAAELIRGHRGAIENQVNWVKDVVFHEDDSLIQSAHPATLMALLRSWAMSAFRKAGHASITKAIRLFSHNLRALLSFF